MSIATILHGKSTEPEAARVVELVEGVQEGDVIRHERFAEVMDTSYGTSRYRTIINAARKRLLKAGQALVPSHGVGYVKADGHGQMHFGVSYIGSAVKRVLVGHRIVESIEEGRLNESDIRAREFIVKRGLILSHLCQAERKSITTALTAPPETRPQIAAVN